MIQIGDVFAMSISDTEKYDSDTADHPTESSSSFVDNKITKPLVIDRDCIISAAPLGTNPNAKFGPDIIQGCRARLIAIDATREPITVIDSTGTYLNMEITSLVFNRTIKTGDALAFKISFKRLDIRINQRSVVKVAIPRAAAPVKKAAKTSGTPNPPPPEKDIDPLRKVGDFISNGVGRGNFFNTPVR